MKLFDLIYIIISISIIISILPYMFFLSNNFIRTHYIYFLRTLILFVVGYFVIIDLNKMKQLKIIKHTFTKSLVNIDIYCMVVA